MFSLYVKPEMPIEYIEISSLWVRGELGPMSVWSTPDGWQGKHEDGAEWTRHFDGSLEPSHDVLAPLELQPNPMGTTAVREGGPPVPSHVPSDKSPVSQRVDEE